MGNFHSFSHVLRNFYRFNSLNFDGHFSDIFHWSQFSLIYYFLYDLLYYFFYFHDLLYNSGDRHYLLNYSLDLNDSGYLHDLFDNFLDDAWRGDQLLPDSLEWYNLFFNNIPRDFLLDDMHFWFGHLKYSLLKQYDGNFYMHWLSDNLLLFLDDWLFPIFSLYSYFLVDHRNFYNPIHRLGYFYCPCLHRHFFYSLHHLYLSVVDGNLFYNLHCFYYFLSFDHWHYFLYYLWMGDYSLYYPLYGYYFLYVADNLYWFFYHEVLHSLVLNVLGHWHYFLYNLLNLYYFWHLLDDRYDLLYDFRNFNNLLNYFFHWHYFLFNESFFDLSDQLYYFFGPRNFYDFGLVLHESNYLFNISHFWNLGNGLESILLQSCRDHNLLSIFWF